MVVRTLGLMIVRRMLGLLGCGLAPVADAVESRAPSSVGGVASSGAVAAVFPGGSDAVGLVGEAVAPAAVGGVLGHTVDVAALASGTGGLPLDLSDQAG